MADTVAPTSVLGLALTGNQGIATLAPQNLKGRLDLFDESIVFTRYENGRPRGAAYEVAAQDVVAAFSGQPIATGLLPQGCVFFARSEGRDVLGIYLPPGRRTLKAPEVYDVPLPGLLFVGAGTDYHIFAVKQYPSNDLERLFHAPFPNVHTTGRICCGSVVFPVCDAGSIYKAATLFFESEFNNHLVQGKSAKHKADIRKRWKVLQRAHAEEYPLDDLVRTERVLRDYMGGK